MDIKEIRDRSGLSRAAFSRKYEIPVRTLEDWEAGRRTPPAYVVRILGSAVEEDFGMTPSELHLVDKMDLGGGFGAEKYKSSDYEVSVARSGETVTVKASPLKTDLPEIHLCNGAVTHIGFLGDIILEENLAACAKGLKDAEAMIERLRAQFF